MSPYRSELQALRERIQLLEERLADVRWAHDQQARAEMSGAYAPSGFARLMYGAGRSLGNAIRRRRMRRYDNELDAARARVALLEAVIVRGER